MDFIMKKKNVLRLVIFIIVIIVILLSIIFAYKKIVKNRFKKILMKNDSTNYELLENSNNEEINVKVKDKKILLQSGDNITWVDELESKRIIMNSKNKIAILTENDSNLKVNSLNYTYINDYFENSKEKFKYLGKKDGCYLLEFTNKQTGIITCLYLNVEKNIVEKVVKKSNNGSEFISKFEVKINTVSNKEVEVPDLTGYHIQDSASSVVNIENK